jgi:hypothetical protein
VVASLFTLSASRSARVQVGRCAALQNRPPKSTKPTVAETGQYPRNQSFREILNQFGNPILGLLIDNLTRQSLINLSIA